MPKKDDEKVSVSKDEFEDIPIAKSVKAEKEEPKPEPKPTTQKPEEVPRAIPSKHVEEQATAMGMATVQKYIGGCWRQVHKGRPFIGPKHVVDALKRAKFVQ